MENELSRVVDALPGSIWTALPDGHVDFLNRSWCDYTGLSLAEGLGHGWQSAVHPGDLPGLLESWRSILAPGAPREFEARLRRFDGMHRLFLIRVAPLTDDSGRLVKWCGLNFDVEDRNHQQKLAEQALGKARSDLARVARMTSLNTLTASIAHEVNQPLSGIITNASTCLRMLAAAPPNIDGARETARRTIRDGNRASDIILRLRSLFSQTDAKADPVDLNEATREVIALSVTELQRGGVMLRAELSEDLPPVTGDRVQLQQVILNLLLNASDAMSGIDDRPRNLTVRTEREEPDRIRLDVQDAGVGFGPQGADKLFEPFYTTKSGGMGIGLSVSRSIIENHHGRLWAVPNDGPGATFCFSIPCGAASLPGTRSPGVPSPEPTDSGRGMGNAL